jgi:hypothetical protein
MASFVVKAAPRPDDADWLKFDEKTMWHGKDIRAGDEVFIFAAEHNGGRGLYARGIVIEAIRGVGSRVSLTVKRTCTTTGPSAGANCDRPVIFGTAARRRRSTASCTVRRPTRSPVSPLRPRCSFRASFEDFSIVSVR